MMKIKQLHKQRWLRFYKKTKQQQQPMAPKVDLFVVKEQKQMPVSLVFPARISAAKEVSITARVSGVLERQLYTEGL